MQIQALTAGVGAGTAPFSGFVHSVFTRACNILEQGDDKILTLATRDVGALPRGFQLATPPGFNFLKHVRVNTAVASRGGILRIHDSTLSIDTRSARPWSATSTRFAPDFARKKVAYAWETAYLMLLEQRQKIGLPSQATLVIAALSHAVRMRQGDDAARMAAALIGLGDGLTPAGDDFLIGFFAALRLVGASDNVRRAFLADFSAAIKVAAFRTNVISRSYLEAATSGEVSEPLVAVIECIASGAAPEIVRARVRTVFAVGASSGIAAVFGFLAGVVAWDGLSPIEESTRRIIPSLAYGTFDLFFKSMPKDKLIYA